MMLTAENAMPRYKEISSLLTKNIGIQELLVTGVMKMIISESGTNHAASRSHELNIVRGTNARMIATNKKAELKRYSGVIIYGNI
ncbi:MAG: hypothetical protein AAB555_00265 [Patescibacteria group bacterium]